jgi:integrase
LESVLAEARADWVRQFIEFKQRGTNNRGGRVPKVSTLAYYGWMLNRIALSQLDLKTCTLLELNAFLDSYRKGRSINSFSDMVTIIKQVLVYFERHDLNAKIRTPARPDPTQSIQDKTISDSDLSKLIKGASNLRDRLLIELLSELGSRRGEIYNIRIKDVQFDQYSAILTLTGKSGTRNRRVYGAVPDLRSYLNEHPHHDDPLAPLFLTTSGKPLKNAHSIWVLVRRLSMRVLKHPIHPHQFRHTKATKDSSYFTDREMMKLYGWKKPDMVSVYSHISMRDVDSKDLVLHGLKQKEDVLRPIMQVQKCRKCNEDNAPIATYCQKCGAILTVPENPEEIRALKDQVSTYDLQLRNLEILVKQLLAEKEPTKA